MPLDDTPQHVALQDQLPVFRTGLELVPNIRLRSRTLLASRTEPRSSPKARVGFGHVLFTTEKGVVVNISREGVFRSFDKGKTWQYCPDAYTDKQVSEHAVFNGGQIVSHPEYGWVTVGHYMSKPTSTGSVGC